MSARAVITMSPEQYLSGLKQLEAATAKSSNKMENSFKEYGTAINKAGIAMRYMSAEMGAGSVAFGRAFQVLAGGKIAIAVAAIAGAFTALKKIMDQITVSEKEHNQILDSKIQLGDKDLDTLRKQQSEEDGYMERLRDLSARENKTNEEKAESLRLAQILADKYGDLGISVSDLTGDYSSLTDAIKKMDEAQKAQRLEALAQQIANLQSKSDALAKTKIGGNLASDVWEFFGGTSKLAESNRQEYLKKDTAGKLAYAQEMVNSGAKTEESIRFWSEQIETLTKIQELEKQMLNLRVRGSETTKEETDELKKQSEESRKAADERDSADKARVAELNEEAKLQEEIDRKHGEALQKEFEKEQQIAAEHKKAAEQRRTNDIASLRGMALRRLGRDEEADIEEALYAETQAQGAPLDKATRADLISRVKARRALSAAMETSASPELYAPRVNSLIARGGSSAPVKMPEVEKLQNKQLDATNKTNQIAQRILNQVDSWNTI